MPQNISQFTATGSYSDSTTADITTAATWSVSDTSIATVGAHTGLLYMTDAGRIWGGTIGLTATLSPGTPGTASVVIVASDSGSIAPRMPQSDDQWVALGLSPWGSYFGLQEPSGSSCASSGSFPLTISPSAAAGVGVGPQMGSTQPGWVRNFIVMTGSAGMNYSWPGGTPPGMTSSIAFLLYGQVGQLSAPDLPIVGNMRSNATNAISIISDQDTTSLGSPGLDVNASRKRMTGPVPTGYYDRVHPFLLVINTSSMQILAATDNGIVTSSSLGPVVTAETNFKGFGGWTGAGKGVSGSYGYFAVCTGSIAESLSDPAAAGAFLQKLAWKVPWASCPIDSGTIKLPFLPFHWESLGIQPWTATWNLQEAAGNFYTNDVWTGTDFNGFKMIAVVDSFGASLPAWNRTGVIIRTGSRRGNVTNVMGSPPLFNPTGSFASLVYFAQSTSLSNQGIVVGMGQIGTNNPGVTCIALVDSTGLPIVYCSGSSSTGSFSILDENVHPVLLVQDVTNGRTKVYTDLEAITGSFGNLVTQTSVTASIGIGGITIVPSNGVAWPCSGTYVYTSFCTGALAESYSDDGVASHFLKTLGWTVNW